MNMPPEEWLAAYCLGWTQGEKAEAAARFEAVRAVIVEGQTARAAARRHAIDPRTVRKMIAGMSWKKAAKQQSSKAATERHPLRLEDSPPPPVGTGGGAKRAEVVR